jgi:4-hydroxybenzoate polyprenyltransferase
MIPNSWMPCLRICRLAAVFSALSNIAAGLAVSGRLSPWTAANGWLCLASAGLYLAGMVWNDYFDRDIDAIERPRRPIPAGQVTALGAWRLGLGLLVTGLVASALAGWNAGQPGHALGVAIPLALAVWAYDAGGKQTLAGPWLMGACRSLNVLLGASLMAGGLFASGAEMPSGRDNVVEPLSRLAPWVVAGALGLYVAGVTLFAKDEAGQSTRRKLAIALLVVNLGLAVLAGWLVWGADPLGRGQRAVLALAMVAVVINRAGWRAWQNPGPVPVQQGVRTLLSWIIIIDAVVVFHHHPDPRWAIGVAALLWPARLLGRWLAIT